MPSDALQYILFCYAIMYCHFQVTDSTIMLLRMFIGIPDEDWSLYEEFLAWKMQKAAVAENLKRADDSGVRGTVSNTNYTN